MNKKISLGLCLSLVIISITATFAATMVASKQIYNGIISNISQRSQNYESVDEIGKIVSNYYYGTIDDASRLNGALIEGYVNGLGDAKSKYLNSENYSAYTSKLQGGVTGIGIETAYNYVNAQLVVTYVYPDSPAEKAGIKEKDVILSVNDTVVKRSNYQILSEYFTGERLTSVQIKYMRNGETKSSEIMLGFSIPGVTGYVKENVGYIRINGFYKTTPDEFKTLITKLREQGAESMIFDVRNTSEGTIDYAAKVIDIIVPAISGNIAVAKDKNGNVYKNKIFTAESSNILMPFAVLINSYTSGAAELFACDLRDICQAQLIGTKTAGNGTMQELFPLEDGGAVLLTVAVVEPKGGENAVYEGVGITPTTEVYLNSGDESAFALLDENEDNQLSTAFQMLASN